MKHRNAWLNQHLKDHYVQLARQKGYRSRAAYKLLEINEKDKLLKPGMWVADLGATPGSWSQVASKLVGQAGRVFALDLLEMSPIRGVEFIQGDFQDESIVVQYEELLNFRQLDLVICDIAPNITGNVVIDQARSINLCELALAFTQRNLKPNGDFLVKVFQGYGYIEFIQCMRATFGTVLSRKPAASRGKSKEMYLLGRQKRA